MNFNDYQNILSYDRLERYLIASNNNPRKAMLLYRLNLHLSQEVFTILSCFEISLRNAIDKEMIVSFGRDWLRDSVLPNGIFDISSCRDSAAIINKAYNRLRRRAEYTHPKLLAEMEFGIWKYMFANPQYRASGQILLRIFPNKPRSSAQLQLNNTYFFNELDGINVLRNRIAHHEPICFGYRQPTVDLSYILNAYHTLQRLFNWMNIDYSNLLYGLDHVCQVCTRINKINNQ